MILYKIRLEEHFGENPNLIKVDPLSKEGDSYIMDEYMRQRRYLLQIGVEADKADQVKVIDNDDKHHFFLTKDEKTGIWFDKPRYWMENGYKKFTETIFGINACGTFTVIATNKDGLVIARKKVTIIPSLLTRQQYSTMKHEVKKLFQSLAYNLADDEYDTITRVTNIKLYPIDTFHESIKSFTNWLDLLLDQPYEQLSLVNKKVSKNSISNWSGKSLIEKEMFPYKTKVTTKVTMRDQNIVEHEMIRYMLDAIIDKITEEYAVEQSLFEHLTSEYKKRMQAVNNSNDTDNIILAMQKRVEQVENEINILEKRAKIWDDMQEILTPYVYHPLFSLAATSPRRTHIFLTEPTYSSLYDMYEEAMNTFSILKDREQAFIDSILSSPYLYEVWILLQIIHKLEAMNFKGQNVTDSLVQHRERYGNLEGWRHSFQSERHGLFHLGFNVEVKEPHHLKPDFLLSYKYKDRFQTHSLDAKYKPYSNFYQGEKTLLNDLKRSGERYYDKFIPKNGEMSSAALVHIDKEIFNWNVKLPVYHLSHFSVTPGDLSNLDIYMKRIVHFFGDNHSFCPTCGGKGDLLDPKANKKTYICPDDGEVWVVNKCRYRINHQNNKVKLMKYSAHNYNTQVSNEWNVHCPICHKEYHGIVKEPDLYGNT